MSYLTPPKDFDFENKRWLSGRFSVLSKPLSGCYYQLEEYKRRDGKYNYYLLSFSALTDQLRHEKPLFYGIDQLTDTEIISMIGHITSEKIIEIKNSNHFKIAG